MSQLAELTMTMIRDTSHDRGGADTKREAAIVYELLRSRKWDKSWVAGTIGKREMYTYERANKC